MPGTPRPSPFSTPTHPRALLRALTPARPAWQRYAAAAAVWLAALALTLLFQDAIQRSSFVFFWGAVLFVASWAGPLPAAVAAATSVLAVQYWLVEPRRTLGDVQPADALAFGVFILVSWTVSLLTARVSRARERAERAHRELEQLTGQLQDQATELEQQAVELELQTEAAQKAREVAEAASRAKDDFLATMSHELRTPLNAIGGHVELLEMGLHGPLTEAQREALERVQRGQRTLLALVNDVLNLSRLQAGAVPLRLEEVAVAELVAAAAAMARPQLAARGIAFDVVPPDGALRVRADRERALQVLQNLFSNAARFTGEGGRVTLDARPVREAGCEVVAIRVRDTGPGIPADRLEAIFQPFVQVDRGYTRRADGPGLGLAISRDLARAMRGDLVAESAPGAGSTFALHLPRAEARITPPDGALRQAPTQRA